MLEVIEAIVVVLVLIAIGIMIGIATTVGQYYRSAAKVMKSAEKMMDPLARFYSKMMDNDDLF